MPHDGYGLLEVGELGRRESACFHGYLRYGSHAMRGYGKRMDVSTGLFGFAKLKPRQTKSVSFRTGCKKKDTKPQPPTPRRRDIPPRESRHAFRDKLASAFQLRSPVNNPEFTTADDLCLCVVQMRSFLRTPGAPIREGVAGDWARYRVAKTLAHTEERGEELLNLTRRLCLI